MTTLIPKFDLKNGGSTPTGAVNRDINEKLSETVSVKDFGAKGDGTTDDTAAINAAIAYAHTLTLGSITADPGNVIALGGTTVFFPSGKYITSSSINLANGVNLQGANMVSTIIQSTSSSGIIVNLTMTDYNAWGMGIQDLTVIGDRTKPNQGGINILRDNWGVYKNVNVVNCGNQGWRFLQCLGTRIDNIQAAGCVGEGLSIEGGQNSWADSTPNNLPSNDMTIVNGHFYKNDKAGIFLAQTGSISYSSVNGCKFYGCTAEYNYKNSQGSGNTGYNILINAVSISPNEFYDTWCEGGCQSHVYINQASGLSSAPVRFTNLHHFSNGSSGNVDRGAIVNSGTLYLDGAYCQAETYKLLNGSTASFRLVKANGVIYANNLAGGNVSNNKFIDDETGASTGLMNNVKMNNFGQVYGFFTHTGSSGQVLDSWSNETQSYPFMQVIPGYGIRLGDGTATPVAQITCGTGSPNGVVSAPPGSLYLNNSGGSGTSLYVKESGTGNTGWIGK